MEFLNKKEEVIDLVFTRRGKELYAAEGFDPCYYAFFDDEVLYNKAYASDYSTPSAERQNEAESRIRNAVVLKAQSEWTGSLAGDDANLFGRGPNYRYNNHWGQPIGKSTNFNNYKPAWDIRVIEGYISGSGEMTTQNGLGSLQQPGKNYASSPVATTTITVADGDAASGMTEKEYVVITSSYGTGKRYVITNAASDGDTDTGTVLSDSDNTDTGAGTAGADEDGGIAVSINLSTATQNTYLAQLKAAIEHASGHNGEITVSAVPAEATGNQSIGLTQSIDISKGQGALGGITTNISQLTMANTTLNASDNDRGGNKINSPIPAVKHIPFEEDRSIKGGSVFVWEKEYFGERIPQIQLYCDYLTFSTVKLNQIFGEKTAIELLQDAGKIQKSDDYAVVQKRSSDNFVFSIKEENVDESDSENFTLEIFKYDYVGINADDPTPTLKRLYFSADEPFKFLKDTAQLGDLYISADEDPLETVEYYFNVMTDKDVDEKLDIKYIYDDSALAVPDTLDECT